MACSNLLLEAQEHAGFVTPQQCSGSLWESKKSFWTNPEGLCLKEEVCLQTEANRSAGKQWEWIQKNHVLQVDATNTEQAIASSQTARPYRSLDPNHLQYTMIDR